MKLKKPMLLLCSFLMMSTVAARNLPEILRDGIVNEPKVLEAKANVRVAESILSRTEGARYPVLQGTITQPALETRGNSDNLVPGLRASWTIYDFGKRKAEIERDAYAVRYYDFKTDEAVEELVYELAKNYLEALRAKMSLDVANDNLARHQEIVRKLEVILEYDPGRRSEYTQAKAREIQVQESIINHQRSLNLVLQRLNRYISPPVQVAELNNPFVDLGVDTLLKRYYVTEQMAKSHPTYLAQQEEVHRIQSSLEALERGKYPSLDLRAEANKDAAAVYIIFGGDVFNATTRPNIEEQKYEIEAALARLEQVYDSLKERADVAVIQMQEDQARIDIADQQITALEQVVLDYEDQFIIATRSLLDVVNAYSELASVKALKVNANYDLMIGKLDYLSSLGVVSDWADITKLEHNSVTQDGDVILSKPSSAAGVEHIIVSNKKSAPNSEQFVRVNRNGVLSIEKENLSLESAPTINNTAVSEPQYSSLVSNEPYASVQDGFTIKANNTNIELNPNNTTSNNNSLFDNYAIPK